MIQKIGSVKNVSSIVYIYPNWVFFITSESSFNSVRYFYQCMLCFAVQRKQPSGSGMRFTLRRPPQDSKVRYISPEEAIGLKSGEMRNSSFTPRNAHRSPLKNPLASKIEAIPSSSAPSRNKFKPIPSAVPLGGRKPLINFSRPSCLKDKKLSASTSTGTRNPLKIESSTPNTQENLRQFLPLSSFFCEVSSFCKMTLFWCLAEKDFLHQKQLFRKESSTPKCSSPRNTHASYAMEQKEKGYPSSVHLLLLVHAYGIISRNMHSCLVITILSNHPRGFGFDYPNSPSPRLVECGSLLGTTLRQPSV